MACCAMGDSTISNLREAYAVAGRQSLKWDANHERAIDRIAAAGQAPRVGCDLWKARYSLEAKSYHAAKRGLLKVYAERYKNDAEAIAEKVVDQVLHEHLSPACETCLGSGEVIAGELKATCPECMGHRVRRYSDTERSRMMQLSYQRVKGLAHKLAWMLNKMGTWEVSVNVIMNNELERGR